LHIELRPKKYGGKGKKRDVVRVQQDLGSDIDDQIKIITISIVNKNVSIMSAKSSEGYDLECNNEIVKLYPSHEVFHNSPKMAHEGHLHAIFLKMISDMDFYRKRMNAVNFFD
jgi:hypothetical protein